MASASIRTVITNLGTLEAGISISAPDAMTIQKVWPMVPPEDTDLGDLPAFMNMWKPSRLEEWGLGVSRQRSFTVRMQLFVGEADAELDRKADQANAFYDAFATALSLDRNLSGAVGILWNLRSDFELPTVLKWAGRNYVGLDLVADVELVDTAG